MLESDRVLRLREPYFLLLPSAALLSALVKATFATLGANVLTAANVRWSVPTPLQSTCICCHCTLQAVKDEQRCLSDSPQQHRPALFSFGVSLCMIIVV